RPNGCYYSKRDVIRPKAISSVGRCRKRHLPRYYPPSIYAKPVDFIPELPTEKQLTACIEGEPLNYSLFVMRVPLVTYVDCVHAAILGCPERWAPWFAAFANSNLSSTFGGVSSIT